MFLGVQSKLPTYGKIENTFSSLGILPKGIYFIKYMLTMPYRLKYLCLRFSSLKN